MSVAAEAVQRFRADLEALTGGAPPLLGVAVSGGPDSLALLLLAAAAYPGQVRAATVDHGLRPEGAAEAAAVAEICAGLGVPHAILTPDLASGGASLQARAREARYAALGVWLSASGGRWLATAHHADDQAETILMRLARGAGLSGLSGVRAVQDRDGMTLVRPLLSWRREELAGLVAAAELVAADDPSNRAERFDRTRFRRMLGDTPILSAPRLAAAAAHLADAEEALAWTAEREWQVRAKSGAAGTVTLDLSGLPSELRRRLAARAIGIVRSLARTRRGLAPRQASAGPRRRRRRPPRDHRGRARHPRRALGLRARAAPPPTPSGAQQPLIVRSDLAATLSGCGLSLSWGAKGMGA